MQTLSTCNLPSVVECFKVLSNSNPAPSLRKQADAYLAFCEQTGPEFLSILLSIFESGESQVIRLQSLICFNNVIKRNWLNKRLKNSMLPNFEKEKGTIKDKLIGYMVSSSKMFRKTVLDGIVFIAHNDFPHSFEQLTNYLQQMLEQVKDVAFLNESIKAINEVYKRKKDRSVILNKKHFQQSSIRILAKAYPLFESFFTNLEKLGDQEHSLLRSLTKLLLLLLITAPNQLIDDQELLKLVQTIYTKSQKLLTLLSQAYNPQHEKTFRVFVQYLSYLQYKHPFCLILCFSKFLQFLLYTVANHQKFRDKNTIKYALSALNKVMKTFVYYSSDQEFQNSSHSKSRAVNFLNIRNQMHQVYKEVINEKTIQQLLSKLMSEILSIKDQNSFDGGFIVEDEEGKMDEKDASLQRLALNLVQTIINRFPVHSSNLISNLVNSCLASNFANVDKNLKTNIMSVCSVLPSALRNTNSPLLASFPIQSLISYAYNSGEFAQKFALLSCKWIYRFTPEEILQVVSALLSYIDNNSGNLGVLLECCLAVKIIVLSKSQQINLSNAVQKIIPVAIKLFSSNQSVQILWPMITLISKLISSVQCNLQTLQNALACHSLISLLQTKQQLIIEALCQMFRSILCTLPRDQPQPVTYDLVITFLSNQLTKTHIAAYDEVLKLWYLLLREYSPIQSRNSQIKTLFDNYYRTALSTLNERLLFVLEEYVLLDLVGLDVGLFSSILAEFYEHAQEWTEQTFKLKIAATSVHITFITKFGIATVHSNELLLKYLADLLTPPPPGSKLLDTFKTSILTLINRYIILFKSQFMQFIQSSSIPINQFIARWFEYMESLTSRAACKINAIAILYMIGDLDQGLLISRFEYMMKKVIPEVLGSQGQQLFQPKVGVSPTFRLSQNILSERKEAIRRQGVFEQINLQELFITTIKKLISAHSIDQPTVENLLSSDPSLLQTFYKLLS